MRPLHQRRGVGQCALGIILKDPQSPHEEIRDLLTLSPMHIVPLPYLTAKPRFGLGGLFVPRWIQAEFGVASVLPCDLQLTTDHVLFRAKILNSLLLSFIRFFFSILKLDQNNVNVLCIVCDLCLKKGGYLKYQQFCQAQCTSVALICTSVVR